MASNYRIEAGQPDRSTPTQQYPPYYDPQKQKEKQDLENSPLQLLQTFGQMEGFTGPSWAMEKVEALNNNVKESMQSILMSDFSPHAKQLAASMLLIDNKFGNTYQNRNVLDKHEKSQVAYETAVQSDNNISTEEKNMYIAINNSINEKDYEEKKANSFPTMYRYEPARTWDNYFAQNFQNFKLQTGQNISGETTSDIKNLLAPPKSSAGAIGGKAGISYTLFTEDEFKTAAYSTALDYFSDGGYAERIRVWNDYMASNPNLSSEELMSLKENFFVNASGTIPIIRDENGNIVTDKDVLFGLSIDDIQNGSFIVGSGDNAKTYTINIDDFIKNNKSKYVNVEDVETTIPRTSSGGGSSNSKTKTFYQMTFRTGGSENNYLHTYFLKDNQEGKKDYLNNIKNGNYGRVSTSTFYSNKNGFGYAYTYNSGQNSYLMVEQNRIRDHINRVGKKILYENLSITIDGFYKALNSRLMEKPIVVKDKKGNFIKKIIISVGSWKPIDVAAIDVGTAVKSLQYEIDNNDQFEKWDSWDKSKKEQAIKNEVLNYMLSINELNITYSESKQETQQTNEVKNSKTFSMKHALDFDGSPLEKDAMTMPPNSPINEEYYKKALNLKKTTN